MLLLIHCRIEDGVASLYPGGVVTGENRRAYQFVQRFTVIGEVADAHEAALTKAQAYDIYRKTYREHPSFNVLELHPSLVEMIFDAGVIMGHTGR